MRTLLSLLCFLCAPPLPCALEGTCLRKASPPGTLVFSPGSTLILTCSGHVWVNGVKVRNGSSGGSPGTAQSAVKTVSRVQVWLRSEKHGGALSQGPSREPGDTNLGHRATHTVRPTSAAALKAGEEEEEEDWEEDWEEGDGGSRVTRGLKRQRWKWTRRTASGKGDKDVTFTSGSALSLPSATLADSGTYSCFYRGSEMHTFKVIVAEPPETPGVLCYRRTPTSPIRCESTPLRRVSARPSCRLLLSISLSPYRSYPTCSYSPRSSRCWCTLAFREDDRRSSHTAYMCLTNIAGNVTSEVFHFTPMSIIKPDPPSNVSVWQVEGQETRMRVTWNLPALWRPYSRSHKLFYELKYRPRMSSFLDGQVLMIEDRFSDTITDMLPGVEYLIALRAREQYEGLWSDWSPAVYARSWTAPLPTDTTMAPEYTDIECSVDDSSIIDVEPTLTTASSEPADASTHVLWISALVVALSVILAVYIFSHRDRLLSKLQSLALNTRSGDSPQPLPSGPPAPEGRALVTLDPQCHQERPKEEENEEVHLNESHGSMHFNNTSYFFLQQ